jgi:hypothetical protein
MQMNRVMPFSASLSDSPAPIAGSAAPDSQAAGGQDIVDDHIDLIDLSSANIVNGDDGAEVLLNVAKTPQKEPIPYCVLSPMHQPSMVATPDRLRRRTPSRQEAREPASVSLPSESKDMAANFEKKSKVDLRCQDGRPFQEEEDGAMCDLLNNAKDTGLIDEKQFTEFRAGATTGNCTQCGKPKVDHLRGAFERRKSQQTVSVKAAEELAKAKALNVKGEARFFRRLSFFTAPAIKASAEGEDGKVKKFVFREHAPKALATLCIGFFFVILMLAWTPHEQRLDVHTAKLYVYNTHISSPLYAITGKPTEITLASTPRGVFDVMAVLPSRCLSYAHQEDCQVEGGGHRRLSRSALGPKFGRGFQPQPPPRVLSSAVASHQHSTAITADMKVLFEFYEGNRIYYNLTIGFGER